jgi:bifunctional DNase/RNase
MQIEMTIKGLMVDPITNMPIIILRDTDGQKVLPIWVGIFEANAIALQIENIATPRPMTHDLLKNVISDLKATVQKIVVCDLKENTFFALVYIGVNGDTIAIDARPSDAIALALRARAPIFVEESVIENAKTVDFTSEKPDADRLQKWLESLDPDELGKYKM